MQIYTYILHYQTNTKPPTQQSPSLLPTATTSSAWNISLYTWPCRRTRHSSTSAVRRLRSREEEVGARRRWRRCRVRIRVMILGSLWIWASILRIPTGTRLLGRRCGLVEKRWGEVEIGRTGGWRAHWVCFCKRQRRFSLIRVLLP